MAPRCLVRAFVLCFLFLLWTNDAGAVPAVGYHAKVRTVSWIPIPLEQVAQAVTAKVLAILSADGLLHLERAPLDPRGKPKLAGKDLELEIHAEIVEEAGNFSVILTLTPVGKSGLPSFVASGTASISALRRPAKRRKPIIFKRMLDATRQAAERLQRAIRSRQGLFRARGPGAKPADTRLEDVFAWARIEPPKVRPSIKDLTDFANAGLPVRRRIAAGWRVARQAYDHAEVRHVLERAALTDVEARVRLEALKMLEPASRRHAFTQRVILAVAREDVDPRVKARAFALSKGFFGRTPRETLQTWVFLLKSKVAELESRAFASLVSQLSARPGAPNLDLGVMACLKQVEVLEAGRRRKQACLKLVRRIPPPRSTNILLAYFDTPLDSARTDLPNERRPGPLGQAIAMALKTGCRLNALWQVLRRRLDESRDPHVRRLFLGAMLRIHATPELVGRAASLLTSAAEDSEEIYDYKHHRLRVTLLRDLRAALEKRTPLWSVLAWSAIRAPVERHLATLARAAKEGQRWSLRGERGELKRILRTLDRLERQRHRAGLARFLGPGAPPRVDPEAVGYLVKTALEASEASVRKDCIAALSWISLARSGPLRRRARAAIFGLLRQKRRALAKEARQQLEASVKALNNRYEDPSSKEALCQIPF